MDQLIYKSMEGAGCCKPGVPCKYHAEKVNKSAFPPSKVWGKALNENGFEENYLTTLSASIEGLKDKNYNSLDSVGKIKYVLGKIELFWKEKASVLDGELHDNWKTWYEEDTRKEGKYGAGGWMTSPEQASQLIEVLRVLSEEGVDMDQYLRLGTASGKHTQLELFAMARSGIKEPHMSVMDFCELPLEESERLAKKSIRETTVGSVLDMPEAVLQEKWPVITTHFIESFLPTGDMYEASGMNHEDALDLKKKFLKNVHTLLKDDGYFIMATGTSNHDRRIKSQEELMDCLTSAGFKESDIVIMPTTDPLDYDAEMKKHIEGNYFVVARKSS